MFALKKYKKIFSYGVSSILLLSTFFVIANSVTQSAQLEYIYDLPQETIAMHFEEYNVFSSSSSNMDHKVSSKLWLLSGAYKVGTLVLDETQPCTITIKHTLGDAKALVYFASKKSILLISPSTTSVTLDAGTYDFYCIGKHFIGSINFEVPFQPTERV